tara:strand:+ start:89 stop:2923 length:2835 start_codon:yes stop_codon:yes gene_type:complete
MTDSSLQSLYPVNQIGSDGFNWWIGQVEKDSRDDPKASGRCKVRIIGLHPQSCEVVADDDLPWAITMMPVTSPHRPGALVSVTSKLRSGDWVVGFFMDNDKQQPIIMGTVGRVANSTKTKTEDKDTADKGCNSFTTYLDDQRKSFDANAGDKQFCEVTSTDSGNVATQGQEVGESSPPIIASSMTKGQAAIYKVNTKTNPAGISFCVEKADRCGKDTNLTGTFGRLFSEMLAEIQNNDGKIGTYLVGELSGDLYDIIDVGREYVDKAIRLMKTFVANVKGFVLKMIRKAVKKITDALLRPTDKGNALSGVTKFLNDMLASVGCKMADLGDMLAKWLEDMIFGYLFNLYKSTACQVDKFVGGLINKIQSLMNNLLESILGPLQSILGAIAKPLDMIGQAINKVLNLLGIQCSGPGQKCAKKTKVCTDCSGDKREDFLDKLLASLGDSDSQDWNQYNCDDTQEGIKLKSTEVDFVGGIQNIDRNIVYNITDITVNEGEKAVFTVTRSGYTDVISSLTYKTRNGTAIAGEDYEESSGTLGFVAGKKSATIEVRTFSDTVSEGYEDFYLRLTTDTPSREISRSNFKNNLARCTIKESTITSGTASPLNPDTGTPITANPVNPSSNPDADPFTGNESYSSRDFPASGDPTYTIVADRASVKEGEFVTYTITTTNVPNGTALNYQLFGNGITPSDITNNSLVGTFTIEDSSATVIVGIRNDNSVEDAETLVFSIPGTGASVSVLIVSDIAGLSEEEIRLLEDDSSLDEIDQPPVLPTPGTIVTNSGGGIISIPISSSGDPYTEPPAVFITGEGYGASGEVLLDPDGFAKEIRIVDPGFGYKINKPATAKLECLIDSFTMIRPGREYTSAPTVFVNGSKDVADAVINDRGQIISVRIKDRTLTFDDYPEVKILGGGGYGAKFVPSFACVSPEMRVKLGSAKIGTGSYIDCP